MNLARKLDQRLNKIVREINEIRKELIFLKVDGSSAATEKTAAWRNLGKKISSKWDNVSAVEEIISQREKVW